MNIGFQEILLIFLIILLLFGAKKLPELARGLGTALKEFRKALRETEDSIKEIKEDTEKNTKEEKKILN
ncbi:MAG: twin-arginine translocase TatA/TatE family subunit [candidate division WOR-3 bacterium]